MTIADPRADELVDQAARFDDPALEHLANKGLVRRARKLLVEVAVTEGPDGLTVTAADWVVHCRWETPLPQAQCDCATAGVCQHVLAAIMHLGTLGAVKSPQQPQSSDATDHDPAVAPVAVGPASVGQSLLALTDDQLLTWATKPGSRWALERAESIDVAEIVIEEAQYLRVVLPSPYGEVRFMGPSLDDAVAKPSGKNNRRLIALGLFGYWLYRGRELPLLSKPEEKPTELAGEQRSIAGRSLGLCEDLLATGLLHLGDAERERLDSLGASARGVKLYRLAVLAERASDHINALQSLSPDADTALLIGQVSEIAVVSEVISGLLAAGREVPIGLKGTARARYETVGHLDLIGLGHYEWGDNRFAGSTGVFGQSDGRFFTVARPRLVNGRSLPETLDWVGGGTISSLAGRRVALSNAQASESLRLSGGASVTAAPGQAITASDLEALAWTGDRPSSPSRLYGRPAMDWTVLKVDGAESPITFDAISQSSQWALRAAGQTVTIRLPYRSTSTVAVQNLELQADDGPPDFIIGRLRAAGDDLELWPISMFSNETLTNLSSPPAPPATSAESGAVSPQGAQLDQLNQPDRKLPITVSHLDRLTARAIRIADGGHRPTTGDDLQRLANDARNWGLASLAGTIGGAPNHSVALLRFWWATQLAGDLDS